MRLSRDGLRQADRTTRPSLISQPHLSKGRLRPRLWRHHPTPFQHLSLLSFHTPFSILSLLHSNNVGTSQVLVLAAMRSSGDCVEQTGRTPTRTSTRPNTVQICAMARSILLILALPYTLRFSLFEQY